MPSIVWPQEQVRTCHASAFAHMLLRKSPWFLDRFLEGFEGLGYAAGDGGPGVLGQDELAGSLAHGGEACGVGEDLGDLCGEVLGVALFHEIAVNAGGDALAEGPGVGDDGGHLVEHGFEWGDAEGLVERGQDEEGAGAEEDFEFGALGGVGLGEVSVEDDSGGDVVEGVGAYDVKLGGGDGLADGGEGFEELGAAFALELGADEEDAVEGVVLGGSGIGDFGEVDGSADVEDALGWDAVVADEGLAEVLAEGEDGGHLLGGLLFVAEGLVDALAGYTFHAEAAVEQFGQIAVVVGDAFAAGDDGGEREHVADLETERAGDGNGAGSLGEGAAVGGVEVEVLAPDSAVGGEVFAEIPVVLEAGELKAYGFVEEGGLIEGVEKKGR